MICGIFLLNFTETWVDIELSMYNPNQITATLDRADYKVYGNGNYLGNGVIYQRVDIPPGNTQTVSTDFRISYGSALSTIWSAITSGNINWAVSGTAYFDTPLGTLDIPFSR